MKISPRLLIAVCSVVLAGCAFFDDPRKKYDIYVLGYSTPYDVFTGKPRRVSYWKNGEEFKIGDGTTLIYPSSLAVDGDDVYVGGIEYVENTWGQATVWKNGRPVRLSNGRVTENVRGITVVDGVVYACGYQTMTGGGKWFPLYWKDGVATALSAKDFCSADAIAVTGNDVHVIGSESSVDTVYARYWKNAKVVQIASKAPYRYFSDIIADGNDLYVVGYDNFGGSEMKPHWWKNGSEAGTMTGPLPTRMTIYNGDVYTGVENASGYYKNNTYVEVMPIENGKRFWTPSVAVSGDDVIIVTAVHASDDTLLGSYLLVNGMPHAPFIGDDKKTELLAVVVK